MKELINYLYENLKGTRTVNGKLVVNGFSKEDYIELYDYILESLEPVFEGDYWSWYRRWVKSYVRYRQQTNRLYNFSCTQNEKHFYDHDTQEQLAVLKYYLYRRKGSRYSTKWEE